MGLLTGIFLQDSSCSIDEDWARSGTRTYLAGFTTDCDEVYVRTHCGFVINDPHPSDTGMVVVNIDAKLKEATQLPFANPTGVADSNNGTECYFWLVTLTYGPWNPLEHTITGDPVDQPIDFSFDWQTFEQPADFAFNPSTGDVVAVLNSSGTPFNPPLTRELQKGILRVAWNSHTFNPYPFFINGNMINSDTWNGFPPYSVKFCPPRMPQRLYSQFLGMNYYRLEAEFAFNPNNTGWIENLIDRGYLALDGSGNLYKILDAKGQPYPEPSLLDGSGHVLVGTSGFAQLQFQTYVSIPFSTTFSNLNSLF